MAKYRKRPVVIEAFRLGYDCIPDWFMKAKEVIPINIILNNDLGETTANIYTLEGWHHANHGDYIIQGVKGEIYPCKPDIFEMTYEGVE